MNDQETNPAEKARSLIAEAFAQINQLPHGSDQDATGLIEAQSHLAAARRALDAWEQVREARFDTAPQPAPRDRYQSMTGVQRATVEDAPYGSDEPDEQALADAEDALRRLSEERRTS